MQNPPESALLVAVPEAEPVVGAWRDRFDPSARLGVPAHVTILWPFVDPSALSAETHDALLALFARLQPFDVVFPRTARFPEGVVYLAPDPAPRFSELIDAVCARFPDHPPYGGAFETVIPHLTVVDCTHGDLCDDAEADLARAERGVAPHLPVAARVTEVWLMTSKHGRWRLEERYPLGGEGRSHG